MGAGKQLVIAGLAANIVGTALVGYFTPRLQGVPYGGPMPRALDWRGRATAVVGWVLLLVGFTLQLVGTELWT